MVEINLQIFAMGQLNNENVVVLFSYVYVQGRKGKGTEKGEPLASSLETWRSVAFPCSVWKENKKKYTSRQTNTCQLSNAGHFLLAKTAQPTLCPSPSPSLSVSLCLTTLFSLSVHSKMHKGPLTCASATATAQRRQSKWEWARERKRVRESNR